MLRREHPAKLRADFQQYYNLNLDGMGADYSVTHAADLAANLPLDARCMRTLEPRLEWSMQDRLLAESVNMLRLLVWAQSKDGQKGRNRPKPIDFDALQKPNKSTENQLNSDQYRNALSQPRREI